MIAGLRKATEADTKPGAEVLVRCVLSGDGMATTRYDADGGLGMLVPDTAALLANLGAQAQIDRLTHEIARLRALVKDAYEEGWQDAIWSAEAVNAEDVQWSLDPGPESLAQHWHGSDTRTALETP